MTEKMHKTEADVLAELLEQEESYRVLRAVPRPYTDMPEDGVPPDGRCVAILDIESTGLDVENDKLIELAIMLVWVDDEGRVLRHVGPVSWLEDPQVVIDPKITMITGLAAHHLPPRRRGPASADGEKARRSAELLSCAKQAGPALHGSCSRRLARRRAPMRPRSGFP